MNVHSKVILDSQMFRVFVEQTAEWIPPALTFVCVMHKSYTVLSFACAINNMGTGSLGFLLEPIGFIPCATHNSHLWLCNTQGANKFRVFSYLVPLYVQSHLWLCNSQG